MTQHGESSGHAEDEVASRFDELQSKLVPLWKSIQSFNDNEQTIVVVASMSIDLALRGLEQQAYEERFLFLLLLLRQPRARLVYVTSLPVQPEIVDYYLQLLPGVIASHARRRLFFVSPCDSSPMPLSQKLLERPRMIEQIRALIPDRNRAHLVPYNTTTLERDLALRIGIPMYGCDPKFFPLGTKTGSRRVFADVGVSHPLGIEDINCEADLLAALEELRARRPSMSQAIVKLNEGVSGEGNAVISFAGVPEPGHRDERAALAARLRKMAFEQHGATWESYEAKLADRGGIVEERIVGEEFRSPSAQLRITPLGAVELLSTHDQLLGGLSGQSFLGCRFPADPAYAGTIMRDAAKIGERLARDGVIGRFSIDFVSVRSHGGVWSSYAIENNLRKGGTTHPFLTLQFLTDGVYDPERALFTTPHGTTKCFVATDRADNPSYRALTTTDLFDLIVHHGLHFDQARQTGVVMHMMSAVGECGRVGLTAVGDTHEEADALYTRTRAVFDAAAESPA